MSYRALIARTSVAHNPKITGSNPVPATNKIYSGSGLHGGQTLFASPHITGGFFFVRGVSSNNSIQGLAPMEAGPFPKAVSCNAQAGGPSCFALRMTN